MKRIPTPTNLHLTKQLATQVRWISQMARAGQLTGISARVAQTVLSWTLKLVRHIRPTLATSLAIGGPLLTTSEPAIAQARFELRTGDENPFDSLDLELFDVPAPVLSDIDADGDYDVVVGDLIGDLVYLENTAPADSAPEFLYRPGDSNPFDQINVGEFSAPAFADLDNDGDLDAIIAEYTPYETPVLNYFRNEGSIRSPFLVELTGLLSPVSDLSLPEVPMPALADLDGDGDSDLVIGSKDGKFRYFQNIGGQFKANFSERIGAFNPFNGLNLGGDALSTPALADVDRDGDLDLVSGSYEGFLSFFENIGTSRMPRYAERFGAANPFSHIDIGGLTDPTLADLDGDGDVDLVLGEGYYTGVLRYFENTDPVSITKFEMWQDSNFDLPTEAALATPDADPDKDGRANLIEYGLRSNPRVRNYVPVINPIINTNGVLSYTVVIRDDKGLAVFAEFSDSPEFSNPLRINPVIFDPFPGDDGKTATFIDEIASAGKPSRYMRLVFELQ